MEPFFTTFPSVPLQHSTFLHYSSLPFELTLTDVSGRDGSQDKPSQDGIQNADANSAARRFRTRPPGCQLAGTPSER